MENGGTCTPLECAQFISNSVIGYFAYVTDLSLKFIAAASVV
jgi:hypothetical protein